MQTVLICHSIREIIANQILTLSVWINSLRVFYFQKTYVYIKKKHFALGIGMSYLEAICIHRDLNMQVIGSCQAGLEAANDSGDSHFAVFN